MKIFIKMSLCVGITFCMFGINQATANYKITPLMGGVNLGLGLQNYYTRSGSLGLYTKKKRDQVIAALSPKTFRQKEVVLSPELAKLVASEHVRLKSLMELNLEYSRISTLETEHRKILDAAKKDLDACTVCYQGQRGKYKAAVKKGEEIKLQLGVADGLRKSACWALVKDLSAAAKVKLADYAKKVENRTFINRSLVGAHYFWSGYGPGSYCTNTLDLNDTGFNFMELWKKDASVFNSASGLKNAMLEFSKNKNKHDYTYWLKEFPHAKKCVTSILSEPSNLGFLALNNIKFNDLTMRMLNLEIEADIAEPKLVFSEEGAEIIFSKNHACEMPEKIKPAIQVEVKSKKASPAVGADQGKIPNKRPVD